MTIAETSVPDSAEVIVIGAGSAGCVLARRLVDAGVEVVLIEAGGPDEAPAIHDPMRSFEPLGSPDDWGYTTVDQAHCGGRRIAHPRGKVLGGTSCLNGMIFARGHRSDFDTWAYLGNAGWGYDEVLPLFKRYEDFDGGASEYRAAGGPLHITSLYEPHPAVSAMLTAAEQAGIAANPDYNGAHLDGSTLIQFTIKNGQRHNTWRAFLAPIADAPNLATVTRCHVQRLLIEDGRCRGVEVLRNGQRHSIEAEHEVVVSAGAFDSPKLLMLSGIGPADELSRLGVEVLVDLPGVGENLQDHVFAPLVHAAARELPPGPGFAGAPRTSPALPRRVRGARGGSYAYLDAHATRESRHGPLGERRPDRCAGHRSELRELPGRRRHDRVRARAVARGGGAECARSMARAGALSGPAGSDRGRPGCLRAIELQHDLPPCVHLQDGRRRARRCRS
jgi:choline dehydrogenase-like flavoprotein